MSTVLAETEKMWTSEMQQIEKMGLQEQERRQMVAQNIQDMLKYDYGKWPKCKVEVFGSSNSLYGSPDSDLDMCLLTDASSIENVFPTEVLGFYYSKRMIERKVWDNDYPATTHSARIEKLSKVYCQINAPIEQLNSSQDPRLTAFFENEMSLVIDALAAELDRLRREALSKGEDITSLRAHLEDKLLQTSKRRKNDLFALKPILESEGHEVEAVVSRARIPFIRFRYRPDDLDYKCDLCFDNELGVLNTRLLRGYASFADTASGFLSSYAYVLMSIYYLQVVKVLPNLQDVQLVRLAKAEPRYFDRDDIAFCEDHRIALLHNEKACLDKDLLDRSFPVLLGGFFKFYSSQFDFVNHVVVIRSPCRPILKTQQWGTKAKTWRLSIQDPIQTSRDVGGVLHFDAQRKLTHELRRACEMLERGESFVDVVCLNK